MDEAKSQFLFSFRSTSEKLQNIKVCDFLIFFKFALIFFMMFYSVVKLPQTILRILQKFVRFENGWTKF